jgi:hypothetical protein
MPASIAVKISLLYPWIWNYLIRCGTGIVVVEANTYPNSTDPIETLRMNVNVRQRFWWTGAAAA